MLYIYIHIVCIYIWYIVYIYTLYIYYIITGTAAPQYPRDQRLETEDVREKLDDLLGQLHLEERQHVLSQARR